MKFAKQLKEEAVSFPEDWRNNLISYKILKKYIKKNILPEGVQSQDDDDEQRGVQGKSKIVLNGKKTHVRLHVDSNKDICLTVIEKTDPESKGEKDAAEENAQLISGAGGISENELNFLVLLIKEVNNVNRFYQNLLKELAEEKEKVKVGLVKLFKSSSNAKNNHNNSDTNENELKSTGREKKTKRKGKSNVMGRSKSKLNKMAKSLGSQNQNRHHNNNNGNTGAVKLGSRNEVVMRQFIQILIDVSSYLDMNDRETYARKKLKEGEGMEGGLDGQKEMGVVDAGRDAEDDGKEGELDGDVEDEESRLRQDQRARVLLFNQSQCSSEELQMKERAKVKWLLRETEALKAKATHSAIVNLMEECYVLFERIFQIKNYVALNLTAVSKILKKLDKQSGLSLRNVLVDELFKPSHEPIIAASPQREPSPDAAGVDTEGNHLAAANDARVTNKEILITSQSFSALSIDTAEQTNVRSGNNSENELPSAENGISHHEAMPSHMAVPIGESSKMLSALLAEIEQDALSQLPMLEDFECCLCMQICYVPYKLPECGHRFCDACLFRCYVEQIEACPLCRTHYGVMSPKYSSQLKGCVDQEMKDFLVRFFPQEIKAKGRETKQILTVEKEKLKSPEEVEYQNMLSLYSGNGVKRCTIL
eukprot:Nk52_evm5s230 gene=Nk52_evmTU5s230